MKPLKIIQIGTTHEHAAGKISTLRQMPTVFDLVGVVDDGATTAPKFPAALPGAYDGLKRFTLAEALHYPGLQAVTVEVPNTELVATARRCAAHHLPLHLDKPPGEQLDEFKLLLDECAAQQLPLQLGYMFRGNPAMQFALRAVRAGWLGDIFAVDADMNHNYGGAAYQEYLGHFPGGIMFNLGCHLVDFVVALLGAPDAVQPFLKSTPPLPDSIKNNAVSILSYPHATAVLRACSMAEPGDPIPRRLKISGTLGSLELSPLERFDDHPLAMRMFLKTSNAEYSAGTHQLDFGVRKDRYRESFLEFAAMIRGEIANPYTYEHDYLVHAVVLAASGYTRWRP